jgi:hypothetical protein
MGAYICPRVAYAGRWRTFSGRISWVSSYDNLAAFEAASLRLLADADYMKLTESNMQYFAPGTWHDRLWYTMSQ